MLLAKRLMKGASASIVPVAPCWTLPYVTTTHWCYETATDGNGTWIVGSDGGFYRSTDNTATWSYVSIPAYSGAFYPCIAYGDGKFVMGVGSYAGGAYVLVSDDGGDSWTLRDTGLGTGGNAVAIAYGGGKWVYANNSDRTKFAVSSDAVTWALRNSALNIYFSYLLNIQWANGVWYAGANSLVSPKGDLVKSTDGGLTWVQASFPMSNPEIYDVYYSPVNNAWMMGGLNFQGAYSDNDGASWSLITTPVNKATGFFTTVDGIWVCTDQDSNTNYYWSDDNGATWSTCGNSQTWFRSCASGEKVVLTNNTKTRYTATIGTAL